MDDAHFGSTDWSESSSWNDVYEGGGADPLEVDSRLLDQIGDLEPGSALDLGCGSGGNSIRLAELGWQVLGVDFASKAIDSARIHAGRRGVHARFVVGDATTWEPPAEFDLVVSNFALPAGEAGDKALATAVRALAPGGTLVVNEWDRSVAEGWGMDPRDLVTLEDVVSALGTLDVSRAAVESIPAHRHAHQQDEHDRDALEVMADGLAVTVVARRPT